MNAMAKDKPKPARKSIWGARLKALRARIGNPPITQQQLADMLRITIRSVSKWENGQQEPSPSHQLLIELLEEKYS